MAGFSRACPIDVLAVLPSFGWGAPSGQELLNAVRNGDGGWAQLDTLTSDAYATGWALDHGVRFLFDTQLADESWQVRSRSYPVQTKNPGGFQSSLLE